MKRSNIMGWIPIWPGLFLLTMLIACTSFDPEPRPSRNLEIGEEVEVASQTIPSGGGTVVVNSPGSEIDGMEIDVPPGSYAASRTFRISTAPITSDKLGENFNPLTPLIQIDNGGGYAETPMQVTIPVIIPEGEFPIGFFYNEISGSLEGLPLLSYSPTSVTVLTRHFMSESENRREWDDNLKGVPLAMDASANMLIASIKESVLAGKTIINSGFQPGTDDWEFTNLGSYTSPHGHCAGQSMAALWYYYEKKLNGEPALFHRFDLLNDKLKPSFMWMDNPLGYRFSSVIQKDFNFDGWINSLWMQSFIPELTFKTFAASMLVTGEPQSVLIRNSQGQGGHAMIVYKVDYNGGILHIADPNYPNNRHYGTGVESIRTINLENGSFKPYLIGLNAAANSISMDQIGYSGKTSYIHWGQIGKRYNEVLDSTIGNVAPNTFPEYRILIKSEKNSVLQNGHISETDTIRFIVECPTAEVFDLKNGVKLIQFDMYEEAGNLDEKWDQPTSSSLRTLKPGLNKIGFYIYAQKNDFGNKMYFIDFKWFDVYYSKLKIDPDPIVAEPGEEVEITARSWGTAPNNASYVWNFGDNTKEVTVKRDSTVTHRFMKEGDYTVTVQLYNDDTNTLLGYVGAEANIAPGILSRLKRFQYVSIDFNGDLICNNDMVSLSLSIDNSPPGVAANYPIDWSGVSFSVNYTYNWELFSGEKVKTEGNIQCTMSANGLKVVSLSAHEVNTYPETGDIFTYDISARDVPYDPSYMYDEYTPRFRNEGPTVSSNIVSYSSRWDFTDSDGNPQSLMCQSADYNNPDDAAYIYITFSGEK
ncbi:MAG: PKD domain-containing protein [Prolixibacteraceae bacterium]|nr:PKD domain-containing protein [Prolixibacteraceae bacterium]